MFDLHVRKTEKQTEKKNTDGELGSDNSIDDISHLLAQCCEY